MWISLRGRHYPAHHNLQMLRLFCKVGVPSFCTWQRIKETCPSLTAKVMVQLEMECGIPKTPSFFPTWTIVLPWSVHSINSNCWGASVAQSIMCHDLMVHEFKPHVGLCADDSEPEACYRLLFLPLCLPLPCLLSLSLSQQ